MAKSQILTYAYLYSGILKDKKVIQREKGKIVGSLRKSSTAQTLCF